MSCASDVGEFTLGKTMAVDFPDPDDLLNFILTIEPDEGMYRGGKFTFDFAINQNFPHEPPKVQCREKIYHPNIDLEGKVCLNILREDWKPVLNLNAVIIGLQVRIPRLECRLALFFLSSLMLDLRSIIYIVGHLVASTNLHAVSLPRTECIRPVEQGRSRRPTKQS